MIPKKLMLNDAGKRSGIGSFRVSRGGYFGQFRVTEFKEVSEPESYNTFIGGQG